MTKNKSLQAIQDNLLDRHNVNHEVNQGFDRIESQTDTINIEESQDIENLLSYDEDIQTNKHWDVIDGQLKEFACPKLSKNPTKTDFKNDNKIVQFPANLDKIKCMYIKVLNSDKFKDKPFWWFRYNKERHIAKLIIEEQYTRLLLRKCINSGMLKNIDQVIYHGSESLILHANFNSPTKGLNHCAIKVFKTKLQHTISSEPYVKPDCKFKKIFVNKNTRQVVRQWAKTEYEMLVKMQEIGINAPPPICLKSHCVFMSFIGDEKRAPSLAELVVPTEKWQYIYSCVLEAIDKLYFEGDLVHGDLNENNILWWDNKCWLVDFSQALPKDHEMALYNLKRDCKRIARFFERKLEHTVKGPVKLYNTILYYYLLKIVNQGKM